MKSFSEIVDFYESAIYPLLPLKSQGGIDSDRFIDDFEMMIDDYLQFSLIHDVELPSEVLDATEAEVRAGWDPELTERTLGWIAKHRQRNQAA
ncbi:hypothetical protein [Trueperella abortisuis]|uniref:hypothetical protein n=1 Tax=Trueperella abortisuis TaxID=445930 RepID=UPI00289329DB|nr:hypothetical protein [Trueperella abortisuis]